MDVTLKLLETSKLNDNNPTAIDNYPLTVDQEFELKTVEDIVLKLKTILESKDSNPTEDDVVILLDKILKRLSGVEQNLASSDFKKSIEEIKDSVDPRRENFEQE